MNTETKTRTEPMAFRWARELDGMPRDRKDTEKDKAMLTVAKVMEDAWEHNGKMVDPLIERDFFLRIFINRCGRNGLEGLTRAFAVAMSHLFDRPAVAVMYAAYVTWLADRDGVREPGMKEYFRWFGDGAFDTETLRQAWDRQKLRQFKRDTDNALDLPESFTAGQS